MTVKLLTFVDDEHLELVQNVVRRQEAPQKHPSPVVQRDRAWESTLYLNGTWALRQDPASGELLLWYENWDFDARLANSDTAAFMESGGTRRFSSPQLSRMETCLAVSADGVDWHKPAVSDIHAPGSNVVLGGELGNVHAFTVSAPIAGPGPRYRALFVQENAATVGLPHSLIRSARSEDGVRWEVDEAAPVFGDCGPHLGDVLNLSYSAADGEHLLFTRHPEQFSAGPEPLQPRETAGSFFPPRRPHGPSRRNRRRIWLSRSRDFARWTEPRELLVPDPDRDGLDVSFYSMTHLDTGDGHLGFVGVLNEVDDTLDVWLLHSRDLAEWRRLPGAGPLIPRGGAGSWDSGLVNVCSPPVRLGDRLLIFYGGAGHHHDWWWVGEREGLDVAEARLDRGEYALGLATVPVDRLVGLHAGVRRGVVVTGPIGVAAEDGELAVNYRAGPGGWARVEVLGPDGTPLPGHGVEDAEPLTRDETARVPRWAGRAGLRLEPGARLRIHLQNASVYSISVRDTPRP